MNFLKKIRDWVLRNAFLLLGICAVVLVWKIYNQNNVIDLQANKIKVLTDTAVIYKNALGQSVAENKVLTIEKTSQMKNLGIQSAMVTRLTDRIAAYEKSGGKVSAIIVSDGYVIDKGTTPTIVDNVPKNIDTTRQIIYPTYSTSWSETWSSGTIIANKDSIARDIKPIIKLDYVIGYHRQNIFKPWVAEVQAVSLNPNSVMNDVKSIIVQPKVSPWVVAVGVGYGANPLDIKQRGAMFSIGIYRTLFHLPVKK